MNFHLNFIGEKNIKKVTQHNKYKLLLYNMNELDINLQLLEGQLGNK